MNKLEHHKSNKSWYDTLSLGCVYKSKTTEKMDICLANLVSKEEKLTLNPNSGFEEIYPVPVGDLINPKYTHLKESYNKLSGITPKEFSEELIKRIKNYLKSNWDSSKKHIQFHSGGLDSRILSYVLRDLREEMGKDWIGDIHFRCHKPEEDIFNQVMEDQGWDKSQYSVYWADKPFNGDYFNWYDFNFDANGFLDNGILFWDDLLSYDAFHADVVVITGWCGGEILNYPLWQGYPGNIFNFLISNILYPNVRIASFYNHFGEILAPYIAYDVMDWEFQAPRDLYTLYPGKDGYHDLIRETTLKEIFKDTRDCNVGHIYKFDVSQARRDYIKDKFLNSKFYKDFKHLDFVAKADPWALRGFNTLESKLYGYATMYKNT